MGWCLILICSSQWLNFKFSLALTICESWALDFVSSWCVNLIRVFLHDDTLSILVLQLSWWGRESWLLCLICLPGFSWWLSGSSSRCHWVVYGLWLWYFLIILTYYFRKTKIFSVKLLKFSYPMRFSICFGCSKEPSQWDGSVKHQNIC